MVRALACAAVCLLQFLTGGIAVNDLNVYLRNADAVCIYSEGESISYMSGSEQYALFLQAWEGMTENAVRMPAFGVSIDRLTREEMQRGLWAEFRFSAPQICANMPFERLLFKVEPEYRGFNLLRYSGGKYEGRCYYIDLREGDMRSFSETLRLLLSMR